MPYTTTYSDHTDTSSFAQRCAEFRRLTLSTAGTGACTELIRLADGVPADQKLIAAAADAVDSREDGADSSLHALLAFLYRFPEPLEREPDVLGRELRNRLREAVLGFRYWIDEPGHDDMCMWTEHHQILFAAGAYLAGQLYPDERFKSSGLTGRALMNRFRPRIERWLDLRFRSGFIEWLGSTYDSMLPALLNLTEFAHDPKLVRSATMVIDVILLDLALNQFHGTFGSTHGRSTHTAEIDGANEATGSLMRLVAGMNAYKVGAMGASLLALSTKYEVPTVIAAIAADGERPELENRQRMGLRIDEAQRWNVGLKTNDDAMVYASIGAFLHERTAPLMLRMIGEHGLWENPHLAPIAKRRKVIELLRSIGLLRSYLRRRSDDLLRTVREEANLYTYRTPDYMLSCAQDYRPGTGGDGELVWRATLGPKAAIFTSRPAPEETDSWSCTGSLPRATQYRNVVFCHYRAETRPVRPRAGQEPSTYAWFPRDAFDEVREDSGWVMARLADGYAGLWSQHPYEWFDEEGVRTGLVVRARSNHWICVCGRRSSDGSFDDFARALAASPIVVSGRSQRERVEMDLRPHGKMAFGWSGALTVGGWEIPISSRGAAGFPESAGYRRYDNPYVVADFPSHTIKVRCADESLSLNWRDQARMLSGSL